MASYNNIFLTAGEPFKQYVKTVPSKLAGVRLDPMHSEPRPVVFIIESAPGVFDAEQEMLCVYSEREDTYLKQANRALFQAGMLKVYEGENKSTPVDTSNTLSDEEVRGVASIKTLSTLRTRLADVTSYFTVARIVKAAEVMGIKKTHLDVMRARQAELAP